MKSIKLIIFYTLYTMLYLQAFALFGLGLIPAPPILFVGIIMSIPSFLILKKVTPNITRVRKDWGTISALAISLTPLLLFTYSIATEYTMRSPIIPSSSTDYGAIISFMLAISLIPSFIGLFVITFRIKKLPNPILQPRRKMNLTLDDSIKVDPSIKLQQIQAKQLVLRKVVIISLEVGLTVIILLGIINGLIKRFS